MSVECPKRSTPDMGEGQPQHLKSGDLGVMESPGSPYTMPPMCVLCTTLIFSGTYCSDTFIAIDSLCPRCLGKIPTEYMALL